MDRDRIVEIIKALDGISYLEWQKIKFAVDRRFDVEKQELSNKLLLSGLDSVENITRSLLG